MSTKADRLAQTYFAPGTTVLHRSGVSAADGADPDSAEGAVDSAGRERVRFDLDTSGSTELSALKLQVLLWNPLAGSYFHGDTLELSSADLAENPVPSLDAETRGAPAVFLKVVSATASALDLEVYATPW